MANDDPPNTWPPWRRGKVRGHRSWRTGSDPASMTMSDASSTLLEEGEGSDMCGGIRETKARSVYLHNGLLLGHNWIPIGLA